MHNVLDVEVVVVVVVDWAVDVDVDGTSEVGENWIDSMVNINAQYPVCSDSCCLLSDPGSTTVSKVTSFLSQFPNVQICSNNRLRNTIGASRPSAGSSGE